ncbi:hypothetical protein BB560_006868 [Smittium megazygosporum]|uniref:t-SNARE coiled-coil homology domain-containing protein n=1 Tax=Smittium megazygosporum TaxID=133381 RepID=A0A2T9Y0T2_9FUNG|nr:hypothetical protein BB560_006868 [Smittium megazygosporum]
MNRDSQTRNQLFQRSDGTRTKLKPGEVTSYQNEDSFYERSGIEIDDFIDQGLSALDNLKQQRASLNNAHKNLHHSSNTLGLSDRVIRFINRRTAQDKLILFAGMFISLVCIYYILKYFG